MFNLEYRFHSGIGASLGNETESSTNNAPNIIQTCHTILIFLANSLLFVFLITQKNLRSKKLHQFFMNLLLVHIALSITCFVSTYCVWLFDYVIINGFLVAMFSSLLLTTMDRFAAIKYPFRYKLLTSREVIAMITCSWVPTIVFVAMVAGIGITPKQVKLTHIVIILTSSLVLSILNGTVFIATKHHIHFIKENTLMRANREINFRKTTYVCVAFVFSFILFWMPYCVHDIMEITHAYNHSKEFMFDMTVEQMALFNSFVDPVMFLCVSTATRAEIKKLVTRWAKKMKSSEINERRIDGKE